MQKLFCGAAVLVAIGAGSWAAVQRIDPAALAWAITAGLGLGIGLPLLLGVLLLWRSTPQQGAEPPAMMGDPTGYPQPAQFTRPQVMVIPPMMLQQPGRREMQASWAEAPGPRKYTMIGGDGDGEAQG